MTLKRSLNNSMTVAGLRAELANFNDDDVVMFAYNYGDRCQSQVCQGVENVEKKAVKYSDYHRMCKLTDEDETPTDEDDGEEDPTIDDHKVKNVIVLS